MIEDPTLFAFSGVGIRVLDIDGDPWFVATDVARVLGYANTRDAIAKHCKAPNTVTIRYGNLRGKAAPSN
jgi:prophage antirepressor-like protein